MISFLLALVAPIFGQKISIVSKNATELYSETPEKSNYGCVRIDTDTTIDMTTNACNGLQCPRCFILIKNATSTDEIVNLNIVNCHADTVYPPTKTNITTTDMKMFEYLFLDNDPHRILRIDHAVASEDYNHLQYTPPFHASIMKCFNGNLYPVK
jgi:hypothetical protein